MTINYTNIVFSEQYLSLMNNFNPLALPNLFLPQQTSNFPSSGMLPFFSQQAHQPNFMFSSLAANMNANEKAQQKLSNGFVAFPQTTSARHT
jgi:hypothetical protein